MSQTLSPFSARCYGLARVARVWKVSRASVYRSLKETQPNTSARRPGPVGACSDAELADHNRIAALSAKGDPLEVIDRQVPWESFRGDIEAAVLTPETERKSTAGRKPIDAIMLFRMLIWQLLYNLSDEQVEYQVRDRLWFSRLRAIESDGYVGQRGRMTPCDRPADFCVGTTAEPTACGTPAPRLTTPARLACARMAATIQG